MSFYEPQSWQAPVRQASWEQPPPPSRSGTSSTSQRDDVNAFAIQFEEVDRAVDNLVKSGKFFAGGPRPGQPAMYSPHGRMGSGRQGPGAHSSPSRSGSNPQNFYASQRYGGRPNDADQMLQAKRRMAAQRERELRNYHQEQQYNRSLLAEMASNKSDRSMSPSTLSEEGRRELIARQHRALYGSEGSGFVPQGAYGQEAGAIEQGTQSHAAAQGMRGPSPRGLDAFGIPGQHESTQHGQQHAADAKTTSPPSHQQGKVPTPPSEESAHQRAISKSSTAPIQGNMGPIGSSRPNMQQAPAQNLNKRTTSPLPSGLSYGNFGVHEATHERSTSQANPGQKESTTPAMGAWGTGSGVWGNKIGASVWN